MQRQSAEKALLLGLNDEHAKIVVATNFPEIETEDLCNANKPIEIDETQENT